MAVKMKANAKIREMIAISGVQQWEIAEKMGYTPNYFIQKLRFELPEAEQERAKKYIIELAEERLDALQKMINESK
jgi:hypothetical protein